MLREVAKRQPCAANFQWRYAVAAFTPKRKRPRTHCTCANRICKQATAAQPTTKQKGKLENYDAFHFVGTPKKADSSPCVFIP